MRDSQRFLKVACSAQLYCKKLFARRNFSKIGELYEVFAETIVAIS